MEWEKFLLALATGVITAAWAITKWKKQREADNEKDRKKLAALYVLPFLSACEELQSRLYNILEHSGLEPLRQRSADHEYATEILHMIAQYFGWERCARRYGPYTQNQKFIKLTEAVRATFAKDLNRKIGEFCFFRPEQKAMANMVMKRMSGEFGPEFETMPLYEFKQQLNSPAFGMASCTRAHKALCNATTIADLSDRERLAEIQNYLVEILSYIEGREGFSLYPKQRKRVPRGEQWKQWSDQEGWDK
ncbi:MAG: hypothetical protein ABI623_07920 [bacterium]